MVEVICPHCNELIVLEVDKSDTYECTYCNEDFEYESSMEQSKNNVGNDNSEGDILMQQVIEGKGNSGAKLLTQTIYQQGGRNWKSSILSIFFGSLILTVIIWAFEEFNDEAIILFIVFLIAGTGLLSSGIQNLLFPNNLEQVSYSIWFHQKRSLIVVIKEITDVKNTFHHEPALISSVHLFRNYTVRIGIDPPSEAHMSEGCRRICLWDESSLSRRRVVLNLKFFEWNKKEDAERAAHSYAKTLGISFDGEYQEPNVLSMIPQHKSVTEFDK